jgi:type IV secretory pathway VirB10-like protein
MTRSNMDREEIVSELLLDAGMSGDVPLKAALVSIGSLSDLPAPAPRGELAALLGLPVAAASADPDAGADLEDELAKRRRKGKRRSAIIAGAVVTAMGLGIGGVAASGGLQRERPEFLDHLVAAWAPGWNPAPPSLVPDAPSPDAPKVTTVPAPPSPTKAPEAAAPPAPVAPPAPAVAPAPAKAPAAKAPAAKAPALAAKTPAPAAKAPARSAAVRAKKTTVVPVRAKTKAKAKAKATPAASKERRLADAARTAKKSAGKSRAGFLDALEAVLNKRGLMGGSTVEEILRWLVRLGIRF